MKKSHLLLASSFSALGCALSAPAYAQPQNAAGADVEEVIVSASRIERAGYEAPTPVTMANRDEIQAAAPPALGEYLSRLPSFGTALNANNNSASMSGGQAGISLVSLRQLGVSRTLVLFDGRRVNVSTLVGGVDMNLIPDSIVERIDIVTGGASAAWGSDAVAGVVNIITNKNFQGVEARIESGISDKGLGFVHKEDITGGTSFQNGRGQVFGNFTFTDAPNFVYPNDLPWYQSTCIFPNPLYGAGPGQSTSVPKLEIVGKHNRGGECGLSNTTRGGLITQGPLKNIQFIGNGEPVPYVVDQIAGTRAVGRDADPAQMPLRSLAGPTKRYNFYGAVNYALTDTVNASLELNFSNAKSSFHTAFYNRVNNITIKADNAFLPLSIRQAMSAQKIASFVMGKDMMDIHDGGKYTDGGYLDGDITARVQSHVDRKLWRGVFSLDGQVTDEWKWNAYYMHGVARTYNKSLVNPHVPSFNKAVDAVVHPTTGVIVCRSTLTDPTNGCKPANIFGINTMSRDAANYINNSYKGVQVIYTDLDVAAGTLTGSPFNTWAGPIDIATGFEWRKESARATADERSERREFFSGNYGAMTKKTVSVKEGFFEVNAPLVKDETWTRALDFNLASRITNYSTSGTVTTWKAGLAWVPVDEVRLRGTRSRDIRAPTISELFTPGLSGTSEIADLFKGDQSTSVFNITGGNSALTPEVAATWTAGAVYSPTWLEGFQTSLDYYAIDISNALYTPTSILTLRNCFNGQQNFCSLIERFPAGPGEALGNIRAINNIPLNSSLETVRGLDAEASYNTAIGPGEANFRVIGTYYLEMSNVVNNIYVDDVGSISTMTPNSQAGLPRIKMNSTARYKLDGYTVGLEANLIGSAKLNSYWTTADIAPEQNAVPAALYFNLNASYDFEAYGSNSRLFIRIDNVLDKEPPNQGEAGPSLFSGGAPMRGLYDLFGRFYRVGLRSKF